MPKTNPAIIKPVSPAIIDPVNLEAFNLVLIDVFSEISVDKAAKGRWPHQIFYRLTTCSHLCSR